MSKTLKSIESPEDFTNEQLAELISSMLYQIMVHHTMYFREVEHQFGITKALEIMDRVWEKSFTLQMKRLGNILGFTMENNIPKPLLNVDRDTLLALVKGIGKNWLTADGIWFQAVENRYTILDAQRCAGCAVMRFCAFEAWSIKKLLSLPENAGLDGLKQALNFRMYHQINVQSVIEVNPHSIVFQMNECIVQDTRKQKGLDDYPCKSTGIMEYRSFASIIDPRIVTECIGCPPDDHPEEWYCAWRFTIPNNVDTD
ncbi:MAG: cytosolic protein [Deltaproteobacteria bacterium]|nr:cytosolic protein [Deltaproteobacteria bacterium]